VALAVIDGTNDHGLLKTKAGNSVFRALTKYERTYATDRSTASW